ncbi:phosphatidate cytidylyltransferase [Pseudoflavitalea sp. G-6-1-2]|uniref:phosphatidate cytidylyltransferase n=1 Tax=Pseudoflavitalea sp. G-6-1-2 TaxID=2728841 RepID=UPI00146E4525|nr:phosphatidate cytidylyltransferase [Pseudoflavitalea sp. G-6-1-2]NML21998.1 phosphatidate cytidylyltransferase [Pseudoflavitalea sp. G-6-1-2]
MKIRLPQISALMVLSMLFSSCEVIGGIFKAGVWTGILAVAAVVILIIVIIARVMKK